MALEPLKGSGSPILKARHLTKGDTITGYYVGDFVSEKYPDNVAPKIKLDQPFKGVTSKGSGDDEESIEVDAKPGDEVILASAGNLKYFVADGNEKGYLYQFVYAGMAPITKGPAKGKSSHRFEILKDSDKKIEVSDAPAMTEVADTADIPF